MTNDRMAAAFERFLHDGDQTALLSAIERHGGIAPAKKLETPIAHRICDIHLGDSDYRVVRVVETKRRTTKLYIYPTEHASVTQPGVPYGLKGEALWRWVDDELNEPTEERSRWSRYDSSLADESE